MATESPDRAVQALRLLVATPFVPGVDASHGGGRAVGSLLGRLVDRHRVALVCLRRDGERPVDDALRSRCAIVEEIPRDARMPGKWRARAAAPAKLLGRPPDLVTVTSVAAFGERLRAVARRFEPDVVQLEMAEMAQYATALDGMPAARVLVDHDPGASSARDRRLAAKGLRRLSKALDEVAWHRFSRRAFAEVDAVVVFTEQDADAVSRHAPGLPIRCIPISVDVPEYALDPRGADPPTVLFTGGYVHPPNADAAHRLIRSIFPRVRARHPDAVLELVGREPTLEMLASQVDGVVVTGHVPSVVPYLDRAAVVVAPVRLGGGMRVKVLEAVAAGKAVVASPRAVAGLEVQDGEQLLVADSDEELCAAISDLLDDEDRRAALGRSARAWAVAHLGWDRAADAYDDLYRAVLAEARSS